MKTNKKNTIVTTILAILLMAVTVAGINTPVRNDDPIVEGTNEYTYEDGTTTKRFVEAVKKNTNKKQEVTIVKSGVDNKMSGKTVHSNSFGTIDVTHANEGYVTLTLTKNTNKKVLACVDYTDADGNITEYYNYMAKDKEYDIPMYFGDGKYKVSIMENTTGDNYSVKLSIDITVKVNSELGTFLNSTNYANYADAPKTVAKAEELTAKCKNDIEKINVIYNWVLDNIEYKSNANYNISQRIPGTTGQQGVFYDLDYILENKKGACGDISALIAGMLRSQGIPCKLVVVPSHMYLAVWKETGTKTEKSITYATDSWVGLESTRKSSKKAVNPDDLRYYG